MKILNPFKIFRFKYLLVFTVLGGLIYVGSIFFLDLFIRSTIEKQSTRLNNPMVNVGSAKLSFFTSRLF